MEEIEKVPQEGSEVAAEAPAVEEVITATEEVVEEALVEKSVGEIEVTDAEEVTTEVADKEPIVEAVNPTPAEQSKALKEDKAKEKESKGNEKKAVEAIIKSSLFVKVFSPGLFPGNSVSAHIDFAKEAAMHLVVNNQWSIESKVLDDGSVIQFISK